MSALFALAALVQLNDPDPARWVAVYGAAFLLSILAALRRPVPAALPAAIGIVALVWAGTMAFGPSAFGSGRADLDFVRMFDAWEMRSIEVERAREVVGLLIVAAWMAVLAARAVRRSQGRVA